MTNRIETTIFENLIGNEDYARKVLPFLQNEYFDTSIDKHLFKAIKEFFDKHNKAPTKKILTLYFEDIKGLTQDEYTEIQSIIKELGEPEKNEAWLIERTEKFCKEKAVYNGIMTAISIMEGRNTKYNKEAIPSILSEALAVSFDKSIGHDYYLDAEKRFKFYHLKEDRIPFGLEMFNKITKGGLPRKTLSCVIAGTNVGKSLFLCDHAASVIRQGYNALYITLEMSEERIAERIDCNLMDISIDQLMKIKQTEFESKIDELKQKHHGKLIIKEYPTASAHVGHFKSLLEELKLKRNFIPDIIYVDYINICASQRYKSSNYNSYFAIKAIAEELRGMAVEYDVPILTATQTTRMGSVNQDVDMTDTAESFGLPMTLDMLFAIIRSEELDNLNQLLIKQLKSRFNDINYYKRFTVGVDISKFKLYDCDNPTEDLVDIGKTDDEPIFDKSTFGKEMKKRRDYTELNFD